MNDAIIFTIIVGISNFLDGKFSYLGKVNLILKYQI